MLLSLLFVGRVDEYVIEVAHSELVNIRPQAVGDVTLEGHRGIRQSEGHNPVFALAVTGSKCRLALIAFLDADEMLGIPEVEPGENLSTAHMSKHFRDQWKGVSIFYCT